MSRVASARSFAAAVVWSAVLLVNAARRAGAVARRAASQAAHRVVAANVVDVRAVERLPRLPQQPGRADRRGCVDRRQLARIDDGELRARSRTSSPASGARRSTIRRIGAEIEDECATCHMPAAQKVAHAAGGHGADVLRTGQRATGPMPLDDLAARRRVVHGLPPDRSRPARHAGELQRQLRGRLAARQRTAPRLRPVRPGCRAAAASCTRSPASSRSRRRTSSESELCATCHTLITEALGPDGAVIGSLPEQMNYQEWRHSAFDAEQRSCQSCHMPRAEGPVRVASVLGDERAEPGAAHVPRRQCLHASADEPLPRRAWRRGDVARSSKPRRARRCGSSKRTPPRSASSGPTMAGGTLALDVVVRNLTGHKFPTGYPSRRAWLHVTATDRAGPHRVRVRTA